MKHTLKLAALIAASWLGILTSSPAADDILFGGLGDDFLLAFDRQDSLLVVFGNEKDNRIEVAQKDDGSLFLNGNPIVVGDLRLTVKNTAAVAIHGGAGNDILIGHHLPQVALCGGEDEDLLVWDNGSGDFLTDYYGRDQLVWNSPDDSAAGGGGGLDILIGNTGGDRLSGDLGNDWIVGGTGRDSAYGGWGNDLLQADDVLGATGN